jgi:hydrogenase maturation protease
MLAEAHGLDPVRVLRLAATLGASVGRVLLVGCEPSLPDESEDFGGELSGPVRAAVDEAVSLVEGLVAHLLRGEEVGSGGDDTIFTKEPEPCCD